MNIPFNEKELEVVSVLPATQFSPEFEIYSYPLSERMAYTNALKGNPTWLITGQEAQLFNPRIVPDNVARGFVSDAEPFNADEDSGGADMFGIEWVYVPQVGGSMEKPGVPHILEDVNDWREVVQFPDIDSWDWEKSAQKNQDFIKDDKFVQTWIFTGWFERLISFMGFENAAIALVDDDQIEAVKALMDALSDTYIDLIDHFVKYYGHIDSFYIHDDWGSQQAPFFSVEIARDVFVPAMKRVTDHIHELGCFAELHSCGNHGVQQIENLVAAGWDAWTPQPMNDIDAMWQGWGDKIVLTPLLPLSSMFPSDEELSEAVDAYIARYCTTPGKPIMLNMLDGIHLTPAVRKKLYIESRKAFAQWPEA